MKKHLDNMNRKVNVDQVWTICRDTGESFFPCNEKYITLVYIYEYEA